MNNRLPGPPLRIAVLGDFDSIHTRRYLRLFVERGHDLHAISYYRPVAELPGVTLHTLAGASSLSSHLHAGITLRSRLQRIAPPSLMRFAHALRYQRAGLTRVLRDIRPDVFHAHYVVEHGFYGALTGVRPYVVTAWGSDLLRESYTPLGRLIAGWVLRRADLITGNDPTLLRRAAALGAPPEQTALVRLGVDRLFLDAVSVNLGASTDTAPPTLICDRALEPLYNVETVLRAFARLRERLPAGRLLIAGDGGQRAHLEALARHLGLGASAQFLGRLPPNALRDALAAAHVYVSVPSSDSMAVSNLEAMAVGAFPVLSDLPSLEGWITPGSNGLLVPPSPSVEVLANALYDALTNAERRRKAAEVNRKRVETEGLNETNMLLLERHYYRLAGHPVAGEGVI